MSTILGLDLGTKTGWAVTDRGIYVASGTRIDKPGRYDGGGMRFLRFRKWLGELMDTTAFEAVFFEEVRNHAGVDAAHVYGGYLAHLTMWCEEHQVPYQGIPVGTIKKNATGKGNASKEQIIAAMKERWSAWKGGDDNEADALAILHSALGDQPQPEPARRRRICKEL